MKAWPADLAAAQSTTGHDASDPSPSPSPSVVFIPEGAACPEAAVGSAHQLVTLCRAAVNTLRDPRGDTSHASHGGGTRSR